MLQCADSRQPCPRAPGRPLQVAVKVAKPGAREGSLVAREAKVLRSLGTTGCVPKVFHVDRAKGQQYIAMELCGKNLAELISAPGQQAGGFGEALALELGQHMLYCVAAVHFRGYIHRDIKTLNVFIDAQGNAKIGDLGIARTLSEHTRFIRTVVGTPFYLSPELCEDKPYNEKSDVWALGVCLYEFCTGRHPFEAQNEGALIRKIMKGVYQPVEGYSRELCEVSRMCLTANPDHRPDTNRLLGLAGVKAKIRELRIDIVDRADAAKVQQDYGASRQLHRAGEPVGSRRGSAGPSLQGSRGGGSSAGPPGSHPSTVAPMPNEVASSSRRPSSRGGSARARGATPSSNRGPGAPFDMVSSGTDPFLAYEMQKARIDDGVTAQVQVEMAAQKQAIARAMKQDNIGALMGNPHMLSAGGSWTRPRSSPASAG